MEGYPRRLTSATAIGKAMDFLYREIRVGLVSPEMGRLLLAILSHIMETQAKRVDGDATKGGQRAKIARMVPRLDALLTQAEQLADREAAAKAAAGSVDPETIQNRIEESEPSSLARNGRPQPPPRLIISHAS